MVDAHIHIEFQDYSLETIEKMVDRAIERGIDEIRVLDHTHKFQELKELYIPIEGNPFSKAWYDRKKPIPLENYLHFIEEVKKHQYPIKIKFGLEVCYFEQTEVLLKQILSRYHFDFIIGSVHFIDGVGFDLSPQAWEGYDSNHFYKRYYEIMESLIKSQLFTSLGHPDSIKLYNIYPNYDLIPTYEHIAQLLVKYNMKTENNSGLCRYHFSYPGLSSELYKVLKKYNVQIERSSDAHKWEDIGNDFDKLMI